MSDTNESVETKPIDFDALERLSGRWKWKEIAKGKVEDKAYPFSNHPDPIVRIEAQDIQITYPEANTDNVTDTSLDTIYQNFDEKQRKSAEKHSEKQSIRATEIHLRELDVQEALLDPNHEIYSVLKRVGAKISQAERKLNETNTLSRKTNTENYSFYVTKRSEVNAYTFPQTRTVFFESGILALMDNYLKDSKGYGLAEDHLALLLAHEVSHSDPEAETGYLNEEYCDVQGMILGAEAGYNPTAALDVEDFLIWLDDGSNKYQNDQESEKSDKRNVFLPSHPDSQHRRLVLINVLKDNTRVLPNQTKKYSFVDSATLDDVGSQMNEWQMRAEQRVLHTTLEETIHQVETSKNLSELLDSLLGDHLRQKAELTREVMKDKRFVEKVTLFQAVAAELRAKVGNEVNFEVEGEDHIPNDITTLVFSNRYGSVDEAYDTTDIVIGGLAKQMYESPEGHKNGKIAEEIKTGCLKDLGQTIAKVKVYSNASWDTSEEDRGKFQRKAKMDGFLLSGKVSRLLAHINRKGGEFDLPRLLSGDLTEDETLATLLEDLGINNFEDYIKNIKANFQNLEVNDGLKSILSNKTSSLLINPNVLTQPIHNLTKEQVSELLNETLSYRMAIFAERGADQRQANSYGYTLEISDELKDKIAEKLDEFAKQFSDNPIEQEMYFKMIDSIVMGKSLAAEAKKQICSSTIVSGGDRPKTIDAKFDSVGLSDSVKQLRIAPTLGGNVLEAYIKGNSSYNNRSGSNQINVCSSYIGREFDFIRLYYGETEYVDNKRWQGDVLTFKMKDRDLVDRLELVSRRKNEIPVYGEVIKEFDLDKTLDFSVEGADELSDFESLKKAVQVSEYEQRYLNKFISFKGVSIDQKAEFLLSAINQGDFSLNKLNDLFDHSYSINSKIVESDKRKYSVVMKILENLPVGPTPQLTDAEISVLNQSLFDIKIKHAKYSKYLLQQGVSEGSPEERQLGYIPMDELWKTNIFEGMSEQQIAKAKFDLIIDFTKDGGDIAFSEGGGWHEWSYPERANVAEMRNYGADVNVMEIVRSIGPDTSFIETKIAELIETNKDRFTSAERDKWQSVIAYSLQPELYGLGDKWAYKAENTNFTLKIDGNNMTFDARNVDHLLTALDQIMLMPKCSYKDYCLKKIKTISTDAIEYQTVGKRTKTSYVDHPARAFFENRLAEIMVNEFSDQGFGIREKSNQVSTSDNVIRIFFPASEKMYGDAVAGFYVEGTPASNVWKEFLGDNYRNPSGVPIGVDYRTMPKFKDLPRDIVEKTILYDRLRLLQAMPENQLKEALTLFALQTAYDNLPGLENTGNFKDELSVITKNCGERFTSVQARQRLFELQLKLEIGDTENDINPIAIKERFPTQQEFLTYVTNVIPEKTAFRDSYILMASELYPLKIGDAAQFRNLMFSVDYGTQNKEVLYQRAGLEVGKVIKQSKHYHPKHARELLLWMVDKDLQIGSFDELVKKLDTSPVGKRLLNGILNDQGLEGNQEHQDENLKAKVGKVLIKAVAETFVRLPYPAKKKVVSEVFKRWPAKPRELAFATRAGMPQVTQILSQQTDGLGGENLTYNSLIASSNLENPTVKSMFYDLMLGKKGLLEEPVSTDSDGFNDRLKNNFGGSEMHKFVDDIVEVFSRKGNLSKKENNAMRVVAHSLIEGMSPTRRATALHNLMSEIPKIDFTQPNKEELRSQIFTAALGSFGLLGAKLGQTDEVIPKGWGKNASSLKHSTEPMPFLAVADIFRQEGLSGDYKILNSAGAASTACGYIVESPGGEKQFVKIIRPDVILDWGEDFKAVEHMLKTLQNAGVVDFESGPVINQLKRLVELELKSGNEINNVLQYVKAETDDEREKRGGVRSVKMPLQRVGTDGNVISESTDSLMIFAEPLGAEQGFTELSKVKSNPELVKGLNLNSVNTVIVKDFLYRALELGNWHSDPHEGNIMVNYEGIVRKEITNTDLVWIDFGQVGSVEGEEKRGNAARFLVGLGLYDRDEIAGAIYEGLVDKTHVTKDKIKSELSLRPDQLQDTAVKALAKYEVEEYMTNFLKATINILPYLRDLPTEDQYNLISPYIPEDVRGKMRTKIIEKIVKHTSNTKK